MRNTMYLYQIVSLAGLLLPLVTARYDVCYVCGCRDCKMDNPRGMIPIPKEYQSFAGGLEQASCSRAQAAGSIGLIPPQFCTFNQDATLREICGCEPLPEPIVTLSPTEAPTDRPTSQPTATPTDQPTSQPTDAPTKQPTSKPTVAPTKQPTSKPTVAPTKQPTSMPTTEPTVAPSPEPTISPTTAPTVPPTPKPTKQQTVAPTTEPTVAPTSEPTISPATAPIVPPTPKPTKQQTVAPTTEPTVAPTLEPTTQPTVKPTPVLSVAPTTAPVVPPTPSLTVSPTAAPIVPPIPVPVTPPSPAPEVWPAPISKVTGGCFEAFLWNADEEELFSEINLGDDHKDTFCKQDFQFNIEAKFKCQDVYSEVQSVSFDLIGPYEMEDRQESAAPYFAFGENYDFVVGENMEEGEYTVTLTADFGGNSTYSEILVFTVVSCDCHIPTRPRLALGAAPHSEDCFEALLWDADADKLVSEINLSDGYIDTFCKPDFEFNIEAKFKCQDAYSEVHSIAFEVSGPMENYRKERVAPYFAFGEDYDFVIGESMAAGLYMVTLTADFGGSPPAYSENVVFSVASAASDCLCTFPVRPQL